MGPGDHPSRPLHLRSYLAPSVPAALFEALADHLAAALDREVVLTFDASRSGPRPDERDALRRADVDAAFLCATSYVWLSSGPAPEVELVGAAWVPRDPRAAGRAVYFGDVLARRDGPANLAALPGRRVACNDEVSLSGYHSVRLALSEAGVDLDRVELVRSGSHLRSLALLADGAVDAAAIDSIVWARRRREQPELAEALRVVASLGPHPTQPLVVRTDVPGRTRRALRAALLSAHTATPVAAALADAELQGFVSVGAAHYGPLRLRLAAVDGSASGHTGRAMDDIDPPLDPAEALLEALEGPLGEQLAVLSDALDDLVTAEGADGLHALLAGDLAGSALGDLPRFDLVDGGVRGGFAADLAELDELYSGNAVLTPLGGGMALVAATLRGGERQRCAAVLTVASAAELEAIDQRDVYEPAGATGWSAYADAAAAAADGLSDLEWRYGGAGAAIGTELLVTVGVAPGAVPVLLVLAHDPNGRPGFDPVFAACRDEALRIASVLVDELG
jgi:ABC-type phosphate/phosphonate transport system substrate-binding protein